MVVVRIRKTCCGRLVKIWLTMSESVSEAAFSLAWPSCLELCSGWKALIIAVAMNTNGSLALRVYAKSTLTAS